MNPIQKFFQRKSPEVKVIVIRREPSELRVAEWRASVTLCGTARNMLANGDFRLMLQTVENDNPANYALRTDVTIEERAIHQARCEGYLAALSNLRSLAVHEPPPEALIETF